MRLTTNLSRRRLLVLAALVATACHSPNPEKATATNAITGPGGGASASSDDPPSPLSSPSPSASPIVGGIAGGATCPAGKGSVKPACSRSASGRFFPQIDAVLEQMIAQKPELFDLTRYAGPGGFLVKDTEAFYQEAVLRLQAAGLCAYYDFTRFVIQVKDGDASSEDYALILSNGHLRRGEGSYLSTCSPAAFPLDPQDIIDDIRVAFYSIECADGQPPPRNGEGKLRMECTGIVTATPKKADNTDVHSRIHGPDITWRLIQIDDYVKMHDFPGQPFNKYVTGLDPGGFRLCATVQGVEGCLNGEVLK